VAHFPAVKPRKAIRALERAGFYVDHIKGSHHYLKHPDNSRLIVCVPLHNKELKRGTLAAIITQAGLTLEEFKTFL
jgi:predicted RNA binding protein YcfA (HicA-like mRNA interferase family)